MNEKNRVQESRKFEAISRAELARIAGLAERTIKRLEDGKNNTSQLTKDKIVKAFNGLEGKQRDYTHTYLFPD